MADAFLIVVCIVMPIIILLGNVYVLINFQHPEDNNQAYAPKIVVVLGLTLAVVSVLMFPLDVANRRACDEAISAASCDLSLPMKDLWYAVYIMMSLMVAFVIPFMIFFYEADYELSLRGKIWSALMWNLATLVVLGLTLGLAYGLAGFADFTVERLESGFLPLNSPELSNLNSCVGLDNSLDFVTGLCNAAKSEATEKWEVRVSFPVYVIAIFSLCGWALFMVFAGVGVTALPIDYIRGFFGRPRSIITKTEFLSRAAEIAVRARKLKEKVDTLRRDEKAKGRGNRGNKKLNRLVQKDISELEEDERKLREVYPQGDNADALWALALLGYYLKFVVGCICVIVSFIWMLHIILYIFVQPPATPMLNDFFIELDKIFPLFGVSFFGLFCFYLIAITIKGNFTLGLNLLFITIHPMKQNGTLMSSFLFNVGLISLCSIAVIQFCSQAFSLYAAETAIQEIFDVQINNLRGIKHMYTDNVFLIMFFIFAGLSFIYLLCVPNKDKKKRTLSLHEEL